MQYTFRYPATTRLVTGLRTGCITLNDEHLEQTHDELLNRLGDPGRTVELVVQADVPMDQLWSIAARSVRTFFSHQLGFIGLTQLDSLGSDEGGRYIVHRIIDGIPCDRIGEVLINMEMSQITLSDIDIADTSVSGWFPTLYTLQVEEHPEDSTKSIVHLSYTTLSIHGLYPMRILRYQMCSIIKALHAQLH